MGGGGLVSACTSRVLAFVPRTFDPWSFGVISRSALPTGKRASPGFYLPDEFDQGVPPVRSELAADGNFSLSEVILSAARPRSRAVGSDTMELVFSASPASDTSKTFEAVPPPAALKITATLVQQRSGQTRRADFFCLFASPGCGSQDGVRVCRVWSDGPFEPRKGRQSGGLLDFGPRRPRNFSPGVVAVKRLLAAGGAAT